MAIRPHKREPHRAPEGSPAEPQTHSRSLRLAEQPTPRRRFGDIGSMAVLAFFVVCGTLASLHAVLVENQADLDYLLEQNSFRQERIESLQASIAHLDSPEGLAEQAQSAGLVPAGETVTLATVGLGLLPPPTADPFRLSRLEPAIESSGASGARE